MQNGNGFHRITPQPMIMIPRNAIYTLLGIAFLLSMVLSIVVGYVAGISTATHSGTNSGNVSEFHSPTDSDWNSLAKVSAQSKTPCALVWVSTQSTYKAICKAAQ